MVFSTPYFLFLYLPMVLLLYYIVVNLIFYGWGEPVYIIIMLVNITANYVFGLVVTRCKQRENQRGAKIAVALSVVFNLALLGFFKYWDFIAGSLASLGLDVMPQLGLELPIGISFYTFQTMSYTIDVYRGDSRVQKNLITFGTFVTLFPQLIAGPILQYKDLDAQLEQRDHTVERFALGVQRFCVGLAKKVLLANNLGKLWDVYLATPGAELTTLGAWLGIVAFSLQLYFDFSGYSDMAIGLGRMLGFEFMENFNYPYISKSATEFWRRWHISLGNWFRDYLYIPLGGNRVGKGRLMFNLLIVWAATGIWHGASWHLYGIFIVVVGWAIFAVEDFTAMGLYLKAMFGIGVSLVNGDALYYLFNYLPMLVVACVAATPLAAKVWHKIPAKVWKPALPVLVCLALVVATAYLVDGTYNPFLYFRF